MTDHPRRYDPTLVDYNSPEFEQGFAQGQDQGLNGPTTFLADDPSLSDVQWASRCEGTLMGAYAEPTVIEYADMSPEAQRIVKAGHVIAGVFPTGLSRDGIIDWIEKRFSKTVAAQPSEKE